MPPWGLASRAHGMRAADSGSWERVRQLAAHGQPALSCGRDTGPLRAPEPGACELCTDAAGSREQQRAGAVPDAADGYGSQLGRCLRGRQGGAAAGPGPGAARTGRAGALGAGELRALGGKVVSPSAGGCGRLARWMRRLLKIRTWGLWALPQHPSPF